MNIKFTGKYAQNEDFGINFQAKVDELSIVCVVSTEALQDINPNGIMDEAMEQYKGNKYQLETIAHQKIKNGQVENGKVFITESDI